MGALWELSGSSSLGALWELVAIAGILLYEFRIHLIFIAEFCVLVINTYFLSGTAFCHSDIITLYRNLQFHQSSSSAKLWYYRCNYN